MQQDPGDGAPTPYHNTKQQTTNMSLTLVPDTDGDLQCVIISPTPPASLPAGDAHFTVDESDIPAIKAGFYPTPVWICGN